MMIPKPKYFDAEGREVSSPELAVVTQLGNLRTRRGKPPQQLVGGEWVDVAEQPRTGSR